MLRLEAGRRAGTKGGQQVFVSYLCPYLLAITTEATPWPPPPCPAPVCSPAEHHLHARHLCVAQLSTTSMSGTCVYPS